MRRIKGLFQGEMAKGMLRFGASSMVLSVANMLGGILALRWVPPELMAAWQGTLLAQAYCDFIKLGVLNGMNREFPRQLGAGNKEKALQMVAVTAAWLRIGILIGLALFTVVGLMHWNDGWEWQLAAVAGASQWALAYYVSFVQATFRGDGDFSKLSTIQGIDAVWGLLLLPLVAFWGFSGYCLRAVLQVAVSAWLLRRAMPVKVLPKLGKAPLVELIKAGFPLFVASYFFLLAMNAERGALYPHGEALLGLFAPVAAVQAAVLILPNSVALFLYPRLSKQWGQSDDRRAIWNQSWKGTQLTVLISATVAAVGWLLAPSLTSWIFPQYEPAVPAMRWALLSGVFLAFRPMAISLPTLGAWGWHYTWVGIFVGVKWALCPWFASRGTDPLLGVAQAGTIASACTAVAIFVGVRATTLKRAA